MSMTAPKCEGKGNDSHQLHAILPDWCALTWQHAVICFTFLVLFLYLCYLPLPTGQLWHEVANGRTIVSDGVTAADPAVAYSEGVRSLRTNWLGHALVYWTYQLGGSEWLSCMFALVQLATLAIWAFVFQRVSGRRWAALLAAPIVLASSLDVNALGSSTFGLFIFALIGLTILDRFRSNPTKPGPTQPTDASGANDPNEFVWSDAALWQWIVVVALFVVWANIDISVLIGVGLLGMMALSRFVGVVTKRPGHGSLLRDRELHHRTWLFEICLIATLLQPSGVALWQAIFWSSNNPVVHALGGWSPVVIASWRGIWIAFAWLGWIGASRTTDSVPLWNIASAILVTLVVACFQSQIVWFATTMCLLCVALLPRLAKPVAPVVAKSSETSDGNPSLKFAFTLICGLFVWVGFSLSPIGSMAMAGKSRTPEQLFGGNTPLGATEFLTEHRPAKTVWTPKYWADHLQVVGTPTRIMANLNDTLLTPRIEKDYQSIYYGGKNWKRLLRRYQIDDLVVDKENQVELIRELRNNPGPMKKVFEDRISVIYRRTSLSENSKQPKTVSQPRKPHFKKAAFEKTQSKPAAAELFDDRPSNSKSIFED